MRPSDDHGPVLIALAGLLFTPGGNDERGSDHVVTACDRFARRATARTDQAFWVIDAARDRAGAAQVIRSIAAFSEEVTDDMVAWASPAWCCSTRVDERLLELVGELCGGGRRVLGVALAGRRVVGGRSLEPARGGAVGRRRVGRLRRRGATAAGALGARRSARESALVAEHLIGCSAGVAGTWCAMWWRSGSSVM